MSTIYPTHIDPDPKDIQKLIDTLQFTYTKIEKEIYKATDFGVKNRKAILAQIEKIIIDLGADVQKFLAGRMPAYYKTGADDAIKQLRNIGADLSVSSGFNKIHQSAILGLVDDTFRAYAEALTGVKRSAGNIIGRATRNLITQQIAKGVISGEALRTAKTQIKGMLVEQGMSALTDRAGRRWSLDNYAEMLFRTKIVEARNLGLVNRAAENGHDLVQVSKHPGSCPLCLPWQGKILSITGSTPGYPTYMQAVEGGLFHPRCRHAVNILIPSLAKLTVGWDPETQSYGKPGKSIVDGVSSALQKSVIGPATAYNQTFAAQVKQVAQSGKWDFSIGPVKKLDRSVEKVINDYDADVFALKDANRSVLFIDNPWDKAEFQNMVDTTRSVFGNATVKEGLDITGGYAKSMINVKAPDGHIVEIQVTTREMWVAKKDLGGDELYHLLRTDTGMVKDVNALSEKMIRLYDEARAKTKKRLGL